MKEVNKLFINNLLDRKTQEVLAKVKKYCKDMLLTYDDDGLAESFQQFVLAVAEGQDHILVDGEVMEIPPLAMQSIGSLANYAMVLLMIEIAKDDNAQLN